MDRSGVIRNAQSWLRQSTIYRAYMWAGCGVLKSHATQTTPILFEGVSAYSPLFPIVIMLVVFLSPGCGLFEDDDRPTWQLEQIAAEPTWFPDGEHIAYLAAEGHFVTDTMGNASPMYKEPLHSLDVSPDGQWVVWSAGRQIFRANMNADLTVDTMSIRQLTSGGSNFFPSISPDGRRIAYDSDARDPTKWYEVWVMNSDGTGQKNLTPFIGLRDPDWSPCGTRIVVYNPGNETIETMDTCGQNITRVSYDGFTDRDPAWSLSGDVIAYSAHNVGDEPGEEDAIVTVTSEGKDSKQVTFGWKPSWSADGSRIAFMARAKDDPLDYVSIFVIDSEGRHKRQLVFKKEG